MEDQIGNCLGVIENWRKDVVNGDLMDGFFEKQLKIENGNGWCDVQQILDSIEINNKQGHFGHFHNFDEFWCWNDINGGGLGLQSVWNKITGSQISFHVRLRRQGHFGQFYEMSANFNQFMMILWSLAIKRQ